MATYLMLCMLDIISPDVAKCGTRLDCNPEVAGSNPLYATIFSSSNVRLLAYVFTGEDPQWEWMKRDESNRVYWFKTDPYL